METMIDALRLIAGHCPDLAREAVKGMRAPESTRQMRYNGLVDLALGDSRADFSAEERTFLVSLVEPIDEENRVRQLPPIRVTESEYNEVRDRAEALGLSVSAFVRSRVLG